jgi:serpin B
MPRFRIESEFDLKNTLKSLGMTDAFISTAADFSGIDEETDLFVSRVVHKTFVSVDEDGTEAAGATAGLLAAGAPHNRAAFKMDHPFIFLVRDNPTGTVLFMGRMMNPVKN